LGKITIKGLLGGGGNRLHRGGRIHIGFLLLRQYHPYIAQVVLQEVIIVERGYTRPHPALFMIDEL